MSTDNANSENAEFISDRHVPAAANHRQQLQQTIDRQLLNERKVPIPDGFSPGVLIGKNGIIQKQIQSRFKIWLTIDDGSVRIKGPSTNVDLAVEHVQAIIKARKLNVTSYNRLKS